jgi:hypothetical protein
MDRSVLAIYIIVALTIVGLIFTGDNEPKPFVREDEPEKPHLVDRIPQERSHHNITIIPNPNVSFK